MGNKEGSVEGSFHGQNFTARQWVEIFNAVVSDNPKIAAKLAKDDKDIIPTQGIPAHRLRALTGGEWRQIYHAVWLKLNPFQYIDRNWRAEMVEILSMLESIAGYCEMCGAEAGKPHQDRLAHGRVVTLHRTTCFPEVSRAKPYLRVCMVCLAGCRMNWDKKGVRRD